MQICTKVAGIPRRFHHRCMGQELFLSGFLLTREDWDLLDEESRTLFTQMLAEEGRSPHFDGGSKGRYRFKRPS